METIVNSNFLDFRKTQLPHPQLSSKKVRKSYLEGRKQIVALNNLPGFDSKLQHLLSELRGFKRGFVLWSTVGDAIYTSTAHLTTTSRTVESLEIATFILVSMTQGSCPCFIIQA